MSLYRSLRLSSYEQEFILDGINKELRNDGRNNLDYRDFKLELGEVTNSYGSVRVSQVSGTTIILVAVKAELIDSGRGKIEFSVDFSPVVGPGYEGYSGEQISTPITQLLKRVYLSNVNTLISIDKLTVIPDKQSWCLYVDTLILQVGGNIIDMVGIGVRSALENTKIPRVKITDDGDEPEIEILDDLTQVDKLAAMNIPLCVTLHKIGDRLVLDARREEEVCSSGVMYAFVTSENNIYHLHVTEGGGFAPHELIQGIDICRQRARVMFEELNEKLKEANQIKKTYI